MKKLNLLILLLSLLGLNTILSAKNPPEDAAKHGNDFHNNTPTNKYRMEPQICEVTGWKEEDTNVPASGQCPAGEFLTRINQNGVRVSTCYGIQDAGSNNDTIRCAKPVLTCKYSNQ